MENPPGQLSRGRLLVRLNEGRVHHAQLCRRQWQGGPSVFSAGLAHESWRNAAPAPASDAWRAPVHPVDPCAYASFAE